MTADKIRDLSDAASDAADRISHSWKAYAITSIMLIVATPIILLTYNIYIYRDDFLPTIHKLLLQPQQLHLTNEWDSISEIEHPELYKCSKFTCTPDLEKREKVLQILNQLLEDTGAIRSVFSVYSGEFTYRQIAAQAIRATYKPIPREYWTAPLKAAGRNTSLEAHRLSKCSYLVIDSLPDGSTLKEGAKLFNTAEINNCPIIKQTIPASALGYISIDLETPTNLTQLQENYSALTIAAQAINLALDAL